MAQLASIYPDEGIISEALSIFNILLNSEQTAHRDTLPKIVDEYVKKARIHSRAIGVPPFGVNFLDKAMELLTKYNYNAEAALSKLKTMDRKKDLHEPILTKQELTKFEEGVAKHGSEHRLIRLHMKTNLPNSDIVRFYYLWKKTPKGREVWGNYGGRKGSKRKVDIDTYAQECKAGFFESSIDVSFCVTKASYVQWCWGTKIHLAPDDHQTLF